MTIAWRRHIKPRRRSELQAPVPVLAAMPSHRPVSRTEYVRYAGSAVAWRHGGRLERVAGIEPARSAWEADRLPLHHTRDAISAPSDAI